jgi:hypothetical protein
MADSDNPTLAITSLDPDAEMDDLSDISNYARSKRQIASLERELERLKGLSDKRKS